MKKYRLYTKWAKQNKYFPVNWIKGSQVLNLIYATSFTEKEKEEVQRQLERLIAVNQGMLWKFKQIK
jgi:hypothetical protein